MRSIVPARLESGRIVDGPFASKPIMRFYGAFLVRGPCGEELKIIASEGDDPITDGWEHVSVSTARRIPNWLEMCFVKDLFWREDECVVQFHPPRSDYINNHPRCLHLWRNTREEFKMPPAILVGVKDLSKPTEQEADMLDRYGLEIR